MEESPQRNKVSNITTIPVSRRRSWCCSFTLPPSSPLHHHHHHHHHHRPKPDPPPKPTSISIPGSPKSGFRIDPRRILSPGRVSPIETLNPTQQNPPPKSRSESFRAPKIESLEGNSEVSGPGSGREAEKDEVLKGFDLRLSLKGKRGGGVLVLELSSEVLASNSEVFRALIDDNKKAFDASSGLGRMCRIEVPDVENLGVFRETIELMFEESDGIVKRLMKIGAYRTIDVLEAAAGIKFTRGVLSCLKYLEAVPWTEEEEEKIRRLFTMFKFDDATTKDILGRLYSGESVNSQESLSNQLVWSITSCTDTNARNELKGLVKGLLCKSSVYEKEQPDLNKEDLYAVCQSCVDALVSLIDEASNSNSHVNVAKKARDKDKPLIERVSRQVDNINWLLEILLDRQMAEDFVDLWANQNDLIELHCRASPMVRYELSRVSAVLFIAMGNRKLHCRSESRSGLLQAWFGPMLLDFGWLQRCKKGLDVRQLEEALGHTLLTLPLKQQYNLFMEWFRCFSKHGSKCPNLSKAFQIWWRRSFLRGSESHAIESR